MKKLNILKNVLEYSRPSSNEELFSCPFCDHHKPKLSINIDKNCFKCWVCDSRGRDIYYLVKRFGSFNQQQEWLKLTNQVDIRDFEIVFSGSVRQEKVEQTISLPEEYIPLCAGYDPQRAYGAMKYLKYRGINQKQIFDLKIGYCDHGEYENRVIIPSFNESGRVNYFIARSYSRDWKRYKNPPASRDIVFNDLHVDWDEPIVLTEGVFDSMKEENMIPVLGSTLREESELFQKIVKHSSKIYMAMDRDAKTKEKHIAMKLLNYGVEVYKMDTRDHKDVADMPLNIYQEIKSQALQVTHDNFLEYELSF